ncbi:RNA polymerase sigma factor [Kibdelosporangium phytohabitans]|uniref:RNA polymerase subunit sigma-70 n=1 Tax=Kibdelosporangium phytohabitans TaxID=860235 RepID=A0A0N9IE73_9PSEU|nr:RNA polymerase sigma factor [Kibdelosporangium phytohabitans]ALG13444.1 RNA polymerase subunit sigma-70 [Kibdelosporangium phytohabitans]MBE1465288.1 RNA polymerase sigma-70 factor (ECF subfamily) [Kibdelosporangium phytohabitans]
MTDLFGWSDEGGPPYDRDRPDLSGPDAAGTIGWLFDRYADTLHRYLTRRVGGATADDLLSETFLIALRRRHSYDPARAAVRTWLYGIATNLVREHVRAELRTLSLAARAAGERVIGDADHDGVVADRVDAQSAAKRLASAVAQLSPADRDVLLLISLAGLNTGEVAEALGIPVGTVRSRLHRVRKQLRTTVPGQEDTDA